LISNVHPGDKKICFETVSLKTMTKFDQIPESRWCSQVKFLLVFRNFLKGLTHDGFTAFFGLNGFI
jgi:hypothetical protein